MDYSAIEAGKNLLLLDVPKYSEKSSEIRSLGGEGQFKVRDGACATAPAGQRVYQLEACSTWPPSQRG